MEISFYDFIEQMTSSPAYVVIVVLTIAVIIVNGWTDAPNAIASCVATRALSPKKAIALASICNFLGIFVTSMIGKAVAETIYNMVSFGEGSDALIALCAGLVAIVVWAVAAWKFGIPTSESHALIAGISGSCIAINKSFSGINGDEWVKVIYGLLISTVLGFIFGYVFAKIIQNICRRKNRQKTNSFFKKGEIFGAASMAFMHGAQDGQKFIGVFLLGTCLATGITNETEFLIPTWLMLLCSFFMTLGTSIGGYKIIKTVGMNMVKLDTYQGFSADLASVGCLLLSSTLGIPVSTTHTKTTAIIGVGATKRLSNVNWKIVKEMVLAWVLTFPGCGLLGFVVTYIFIKIF